METNIALNDLTCCTGSLAMSAGQRPIGKERRF